MPRKACPEIRVMSRRQFAKAIGKRPNGDFYTKTLPEMADQGGIELMTDGKDEYVRLRDRYDHLFDDASPAYSIRNSSRMASIPEGRLSRLAREGKIRTLIRPELKNPQRFILEDHLKTIVAEHAAGVGSGHGVQ